MTTSDDLRTKAADCERSAQESFDRCDTDGFLSQWASQKTAQKYRTMAALEECDGVMELHALFLLDGTIASTHLASGQYGLYWVLNDAASEVLGRRFVSESNAINDDTRRKNNRKKGFTVGMIKINAYVGTSGDSFTFSYVFKPVVEDLKAGNFEVITKEI